MRYRSAASRGKVTVSHWIQKFGVTASCGVAVPVCKRCFASEFGGHWGDSRVVHTIDTQRPPFLQKRAKMSRMSGDDGYSHVLTHFACEFDSIGSGTYCRTMAKRG